MREKHLRDAAQRFNLFHQRTREARGINEDIAACLIRADYQITPRAETGFRSEAAEVNVLVDERGKSVNARARVIFSRRAD